MTRAMSIVTLSWCWAGKGRRWALESDDESRMVVSARLEMKLGATLRMVKRAIHQQKFRPPLLMMPRTSIGGMLCLTMFGGDSQQLRCLRVTRAGIPESLLSVETLDDADPCGDDGDPCVAPGHCIKDVVRGIASIFVEPLLIKTMSQG